MKDYFKLRLVLCLGLSLFSPIAQASTLPGADRFEGGTQFGSGPALSVALKISDRGLVGSSLALPFYYFSDFGTVRYGAYGMYKLLEQDGFFIAALAGVYGDFYGADVNRYSPFGIQMGAAFAYHLNSQLTLRLNLVPGVALRLPPTGWGVPPAGGLELAWKSNPQLEFSVGYNGNGDIVGFNWAF